MLMALPAAAAAQTDQLTPLYLQLIQLLREELMLLQSPGHAWLSVSPVYGPLPLYAMMTVHNPSGTESIEFGDGSYTGQQGCEKNAAGWCDLSNPVFHRYDTPATYVVSLYEHPTPSTFRLLSTTTVMVVGRGN